ncbi:MAG: hypothetical protein ACP5D7_00630 [Limnospira sp.]
MEDEYFKGRHRNTKRPRSRDIPSDVKSYRETHLTHFKKVSDWDSYVTWDGIKEALFFPLPDGSSPIGHKIFKDRYYKLRTVAEKANCKKALEQMQKIDPEQKVFRDSQSDNPSKFNQNHRNWLDRHNWGITEVYALRHLGNQLGEMNGIPQEIRARSFGHSVTVNEGKYKKRRNLATELGILTRHQRHPLPLDMGKQALYNASIDPELPEVKAILKIIYQLDN